MFPLMSEKVPGRPDPFRLRKVAEPGLAVGEILYRAGVVGIQSLYERGILKTHRLPVSVISVGNLTWGGTGKTPLVMQLALALKQKGRSVAVLTRGYGQDETQMLTQRLHPIPVLVGADRVKTGGQAIKKWGADLILLDDGYQQWRLKKDLEILMVDAAAPFGNGRLIPRGSLREPIQAARRADLILLSRAGRNRDGLEEVKGQLRALNSTAPIFLARYQPTEFRKWPTHERQPLERLQGEPIGTLAGIAQPEPFEGMLKELGASIRLKHRVRDHHAYTTSEMIHLLNRCRRHGIAKIVTTAKDAVRIPTLLTQTLGPDLKGFEIWALEVKLTFEPNESELLHRIDSLLGR